MIYFVTSRLGYNNEELEENDIKLCTEDDISYFNTWVEQQQQFSIQLDTETNIVPFNIPGHHFKRKLYVVQLGDKSKQHQWVFDIVDLSELWLNTLKSALDSKDNYFILHNVVFDFLVLKVNLDIELKNIHDTFLMSQILNTGYTLPDGYHGLKQMLYRIFGIEISKEEQKTFNGSLLTIDQIIYAADDVVMLNDLALSLHNALVEEDLWDVYDKIERKVILTYALMELTPMSFNRKYWLELSEELEKEATSLHKKLISLIYKDQHLVNYLEHSYQYIGVHLIQPFDDFTPPWRSSVKRNKVLALLDPNFPMDLAIKPKIIKWFKSTPDIKNKEYFKMYIDGKYDELQSYLLREHREDLIKLGILIPKGHLNFSWSSNKDKLFLFQFYYPELDSINKKALAKYTKNNLIQIYKKFIKAEKAVNTYGKNFIKNNITAEDYFYPSGLNPIVSTGRISFGIALQLPAENRFRTAFSPAYLGYEFVDTDYSGQELLIMALLSGETDLAEAIKEGKDPHMLVASKVFVQEWLDMAEPDCIQLTTGKKCSCAAHNKFRGKAKALNFGIAYGMTEHGLAERLGISRGEARGLIKSYFAAFPNLKIFFDENAEFAIENLYIDDKTIIGRKRFFFKPNNKSEEAAIGRQAMNFPIQSVGASIMKIAYIKMYYYIRAHFTFKDVILQLPIHDEALNASPTPIAKQWETIQNRLMIEAFEEIFPKGYIKVDSKITDKWQK